MFSRNKIFLKINKSFKAGFFMLLLCFLFSPVLVHALPAFLQPSCSSESCKFHFLAPINFPGFNISGGTVDVAGNGASAYVKGLYTFGIAVASALAVIVIIVGGVQYASTDAIQGKSDGKGKIQAALTGLVLALLSYTLLNTLNPQLVTNSFSAQEIKVVGATQGGGGAVVPVQPNPGNNPPPTGTQGTPINPSVTAYSPQWGGELQGMEGGYASSQAGMDGKSVVRTLDDVYSGTSQYVTLAGDPSEYGKTYLIPSITYKNSSGQTRTLTNVTGYVHDTGSAFTGASNTKFDIPIGKDYDNPTMNTQPFLGNGVQFVPIQ